MHLAGPMWLSPALEDRLVEGFPGLSRADLRYAARLLEEGAMAIELILVSLEPAVGGRDAARSVLAQLRIARDQHTPPPAGDASTHP
jgi:hypothetical protein